LQVLAILSLTVYVGNATASHCDLDKIRGHLLDACTNLVEHISKRQTDLSDFGYKVEDVPGEIKITFACIQALEASRQLCNSAIDAISVFENIH
jgi:hypothetical protein